MTVLKSKKCPLQVMEARLCGNHKALHFMAKAGAVKATIKKFLKKIHDEDFLLDAKLHAEENRIAWDDDYHP
ncbi:MAG: hypothetical protein RLZZ230_288 [Candidatus Parcubacteria bacterium]|jgi:hypothetical protein